MTKNETFKRRVRDRMAKTGERYTAARRMLLEQPTAPRRRTWVSEPEHSDAVIRDRTGRGWDDWCDVLDAWPGRDDGHTAIATYVRDDLGVGPWWAQGVTVGYERIVGLRLPYQMADGTFTASKSMTVAIDTDELRGLLLDDDGRDALFGGKATELRSKPTSKSIQLSIGPGVAQLLLEAKPDGRTKVVVAHERLPDVGDVEEWKFFWGEWLAALNES